MHVQGLGNRCEGISWTGFITGIRSAGKRIMGKRDGYRRKQLGFEKCMNVTKEDIRGGKDGNSAVQGYVGLGGEEEVRSTRRVSGVQRRDLKGAKERRSEV